MNVIFLVIIILLSIVSGVYIGISYVSAIRYPPLEGLYKVSVLRNLRCGKTEAAIEILESFLDTDILSYKVFFVNKNLVLKIFKGKDYGLIFAKEIAEYRKEYPSTNQNETIRKEITDFIDSYDKIRLLKKRNRD